MATVTGEIHEKPVHLNLPAYGQACGKVTISAREPSTSDVCKVTCKFCLGTKIYKRTVEKTFAGV